MGELRIALVQAPLVWENPAENRKYFSREIAKVAGNVDLFILPEMFTSGFTMVPERVAEGMEGETVRWMKSLAKERNCAITGSFVYKNQSENAFYNRLVFVTESDVYYYYDKRHLFTLAGEDDSYKPGLERIQFEYRGFQICPLICYDLRFPAFARNTSDYDLLLYVANWPMKRIKAWNVLLQARAIENMAYVAGVNRVGLDPKENKYNGHSQLFDCLGNHIIEPFGEERISVATISKKSLADARKKYGFLEDRDEVTVK